MINMSTPLSLKLSYLAIHAHGGKILQTKGVPWKVLNVFSYYGKSPKSIPSPSNLEVNSSLHIYVLSNHFF